ncbi:MAG: nitric oxide synthase oxygenase, partial [Roseibacillus sp.]
MGDFSVGTERGSGVDEASCPFGSSRGVLDHTRRWDALADSASLCENDGPDRTIEEEAREAWRESVRCIGRLHWQSLQVVDARSITDPDSVFEACIKHLECATNGGRIVPTQTVFGRWEEPGKEIRIWNHQLIRYAGYRQRDGGVLGDPMNVEFTEIVCKLGWRPPSAPGAFDLLPLVIQCGEQLQVRELPPGVVLEVKLEHPDHSWFEALGLKWYALPTLSDMLLATGKELYP